MSSQLIDLFKTYGVPGYYGENVSQTEHMIQCAMVAQDNGEPDFIVLACLLHDIGHFLEKDDTNGYGIANHATIGCEYLKSIGINERVCHLVKKHTDAKRYMVTIDENRYEKLSDASKRTLQFQGGRMSEIELLEMERDLEFANILKVRVYDDIGKKQNIKLPEIESFIPLIDKFINS